MTLKLGFVEGVTPTKWIRIWNERHQNAGLEAFDTVQAAQLAPLTDGRADVVLVRLPLNTPDGIELSVIPLYSEVPVVVVPKDHAIAAAEEVTVAEIAELVRPGVAGLSAADFAPGDPDLVVAMELIAAGVGVAIVPHSIARLHSRKDLVSRAVTDAEETRIAIAWPADQTTEAVEEFIGIVRGRTAQSSRGIEPETNANGKVLSRADKAKAAARAVREATGKQKKPGQKKPAPGSSPRPKPNPGRGHGGKAKKGKRR